MSAFADTVVLITGAGGGLGRQLALGMAREGAAIAAIDLNPEPLAALAVELAGRPVAWAIGDVTDRSSLYNATAQTTERLGPSDVAIANAGIGRVTSALDFKAADLEAQVRVNLIGVANTFEVVLPGMLARGRGHLVGISSLASYRGLPHMLGYCASKAGVTSLMEGLRVELTPKGIQVTTICPGWIRTPLTAQISVPQPHMMELPYAAGQIIAAIRRRRPYLAFPFLPAWQVRLLKWLPCGLSDWLTRQAFRRLQQTT